MSNAYLTSLPRKFIRGMAGFSPKGGSFHIPRANIPPPTSLLAQIFPETDMWLNRFAKNEDIESDMAAEGFLNLLKQLKIVFLQDSAILRAQTPLHAIWKNAVFSSTEYQNFAEAVLCADAVTTKPIDVEIQRVLPAVSDSLIVTRDAITGCVTAYGEKNALELKELRSEVTDLARTQQQNSHLLESLLSSVKSLHTTKISLTCRRLFQFVPLKMQVLS